MKMDVADVHDLAAMPFVDGTDEGEAVPRHWYVVKTRMHGERQMVKRLSNCGVEIFLPVQKELHQWSDRKKQVERIVIPMLVFARLGFEEKSTLEKSLFLRFLEDSTPGHKSAVIPDVQMQRFMFMLSRSDAKVQMAPATIRVGDCVRVTGGSLAGLVGNVLEESEGKTKVVIRIGNLGCASVEVERNDVEIVSDVDSVKENF